MSGGGKCGGFWCEHVTCGGVFVTLYLSKKIHDVMH